ncbi:hypothetical protein MOQ_002356 [Trypanosoma cruzi marinkellei]|uniref:Uncharacterized protein n=1 Tax=Trypanosoma cruzi marinkellei TaxID=85056 RepID=K2NJF8_TRYCR|nr:hypothetical protein MOQ_002356 [Trypanosoma cruzi marinkellei]
MHSSRFEISFSLFFLVLTLRGFERPHLSHFSRREKKGGDTRAPFVFFFLLLLFSSSNYLCAARLMIVRRLRCASIILLPGNNMLRRRRRAGLRHGSRVMGGFALTAAEREHGSLHDNRSGSSLHDTQPTDNIDSLRREESSETMLPFMEGTSGGDEEAEGAQHCVVEGERSDGEKDELRSLHLSACTLCDAAEREIKAEIERDSRDGVAAIPPLPPSGWKVQHPVGSNYFVMTRTLSGGAKSAEQQTRRYQSVHDVFLKTLKENQRRNVLREKKQRQETEEEEEDKEQEQQQGLQGQMQEQAGNDMDDIASSTSLRSKGSVKKMVVDYSGQKQHRAVLREMADSNDAEHVDRMDVCLTVFAPFRVYDPSLHDPTVDICEWSSFDVLVRKKKATVKKGSGGITNIALNSLAQLVHDKALCMFVRLASVNSEMRIRFIQFLSVNEAQALEEHACFGRGEPGFLELMRRRRQMRARTRPFRSLRRYDEPLISLHEAPNTQDASSTSPLAIGSQQDSRGSAYELLTDCFDSTGEYSRTLCYSGPYLSELSKEMMGALQDYLQGDLAISQELCEYVCQMQFFLEQEEYMAWLGRLRHVATVVSGRSHK